MAQQAQTGFDEAKYDLVTRLFETIIAGQGGYLTAEQQRAWQRWQMAMDAARRAAENSGGGDTSGDTSGSSGFAGRNAWGGVPDFRGIDPLAGSPYDRESRTDTGALAYPDPIFSGTPYATRVR